MATFEQLINEENDNKQSQHVVNNVDISKLDSSTKEELERIKQSTRNIDESYIKAAPIWSGSKKDYDSYQKYGISITSYNNDANELRKQRANAQSGLDQFGNALVRAGVGEIIGGTIAGFGALGDLVARLTGITDEGDYQNFLTKLGLGIIDKTNEEFEIYTRSDESFDFGDSGYWFSRLPSVVSSLSLMIPGMVVSKGAAMGGRLTLGMARKGLTKIGAAEAAATLTSKGIRSVAMNEATTAAGKLAKWSAKAATNQQVRGVAGALVEGSMMRIGENNREAIDVYKTIHEEAKNTLYNMSEEEFDKYIQENKDIFGDTPAGKLNRDFAAKKIASEAAKVNMEDNAINFIMDVSQVYMLNRTLKSIRTPVARIGGGIAERRAARVAASEIGEAGYIAPKTIGERFKDGLKHDKWAYTKLGGGLAWRHGSEGIEEAINETSQMEALAYGRNIIHSDKIQATDINGNLMFNAEGRPIYIRPEDDKFKRTGERYSYESNITDRDNLSQFNLLKGAMLMTDGNARHRYNEYMNGGQMWDAALWGVIGSIVFQGSVVGIHKAHHKIKGDPIMSNSTFEKIRLANIQSTTQKYNNFKKQVEKHNDMPVSAITEDADGNRIAFATQEEKDAAKLQMTKDFLDDLALHAAHTGNIDYLGQIMSDPKTVKNMTDMGLLGENGSEAGMLELIKERLADKAAQWDEQVNMIGGFGETERNNIINGALWNIARIDGRNNARKAAEQYNKLIEDRIEQLRQTGNLSEEEIGEIRYQASLAAYNFAEKEGKQLDDEADIMEKAAERVKTDGIGTLTDEEQELFDKNGSVENARRHSKFLKEHSREHKSTVIDYLNKLSEDILNLNLDSDLSNLKHDDKYLEKEKDKINDELKREKDRLNELKKERLDNEVIFGKTDEINKINKEYDDKITELEKKYNDLYDSKVSKNDAVNKIVESFNKEGHGFYENHKDNKALNDDVISNNIANRIYAKMHEHMFQQEIIYDKKSYMEQMEKVDKKIENSALSELLHSKILLQHIFLGEHRDAAKRYILSDKDMSQLSSITDNGTKVGLAATLDNIKLILKENLKDNFDTYINSEFDKATSELERRKKDKLKKNVKEANKNITDIINKHANNFLNGKQDKSRLISTISDIIADITSIENSLSDEIKQHDDYKRKGIEHKDLLFDAISKILKDGVIKNELENILKQNETETKTTKELEKEALEKEALEKEAQRIKEEKEKAEREKIEREEAERKRLEEIAKNNKADEETKRIEEEKNKLRKTVTDRLYGMLFDAPNKQITFDSIIFVLNQFYGSDYIRSKGFFNIEGSNNYDAIISILNDLKVSTARELATKILVHYNIPTSNVTDKIDRYNENIKNYNSDIDSIIQFLKNKKANEEKENTKKKEEDEQLKQQKELEEAKKKEEEAKKKEEEAKKKEEEAKKKEEGNNDTTSDIDNAVSKLNENSAEPLTDDDIRGKTIKVKKEFEYKGVTVNNIDVIELEDGTHHLELNKGAEYVDITLDELSGLISEGLLDYDTDDISMSQTSNINENKLLPKIRKQQIILRNNRIKDLLKSIIERHHLSTNIKGRDISVVSYVELMSIIKDMCQDTKLFNRLYSEVRGILMSTVFNSDDIVFSDDINVFSLTAQAFIDGKFENEYLKDNDRVHLLPIDTKENLSKDDEKQYKAQLKLNEGQDITLKLHDDNVGVFVNVDGEDILVATLPKIKRNVRNGLIEIVRNGWAYAESTSGEGSIKFLNEFIYMLEHDKTLYNLFYAAGKFKNMAKYKKQYVDEYNELIKAILNNDTYNNFLSKHKKKSQDNSSELERIEHLLSISKIGNDTIDWKEMVKDWKQKVIRTDRTLELIGEDKKSVKAVTTQGTMKILAKGDKYANITESIVHSNDSDNFEIIRIHKGQLYGKKSVIEGLTATQRSELLKVDTRTTNKAIIITDEFGNKHICYVDNMTLGTVTPDAESKKEVDELIANIKNKFNIIISKLMATDKNRVELIIKAANELKTLLDENGILNNDNGHNLVGDEFIPAGSNFKMTIDSKGITMSMYSKEIAANKDNSFITIKISFEGEQHTQGNNTRINRVMISGIDSNLLSKEQYTILSGNKGVPNLLNTIYNVIIPAMRVGLRTNTLQNGSEENKNYCRDLIRKGFVSAKLSSVKDKNGKPISNVTLAEANKSDKGVQYISYEIIPEQNKPATKENTIQPNLKDKGVEEIGNGITESVSKDITKAKKIIDTIDPVLGETYSELVDLIDKSKQYKVGKKLTKQQVDKIDSSENLNAVYNKTKKTIHFTPKFFSGRFSDVDRFRVMLHEGTHAYMNNILRLEKIAPHLKEFGKLRQQIVEQLNDENFKDNLELYLIDKGIADDELTLTSASIMSKMYDLINNSSEEKKLDELFVELLTDKFVMLGLDAMDYNSEGETKLKKSESILDRLFSILFKILDTVIGKARSGSILERMIEVLNADFTETNTNENVVENNNELETPPVKEEESETSDIVPVMDKTETETETTPQVEEVKQEPAQPTQENTTKKQTKKQNKETKDKVENKTKEIVKKETKKKVKKVIEGQQTLNFEETDNQTETKKEEEKSELLPIVEIDMENIRNGNNDINEILDIIDDFDFSSTSDLLFSSNSDISTDIRFHSVSSLLNTNPSVASNLKEMIDDDELEIKCN